MTGAPVLPSERAFLRLMAELASDGLFTGPERDGMWDRIVEAFEAAMEEARAQTNARASDHAHQPQSHSDHHHD